VSRLRKLIPRQMFEVPIQAAIGSRVIARETVAAMRQERAREVLRRRHFRASAKLLEKQKEGKKRNEARRPRGHSPGSNSWPF